MIEQKLKNKIYFSALLLSATCILLTATVTSAVEINWGAGNYPILDENGDPLEDGDLAQLIWDQEGDGIDPPSSDGMPTDDDRLIAASFLGKGSFLEGRFSENTSTTMVGVGDFLYVRAWNGPNPAEATHYGDTRDHTPSVWALGNDYSFTLDATSAQSWSTRLGGVTGVETEPPPRVRVPFALFQNHPNPFHASTAIFYSIPTPTHLLLNIYDITGRRVRTLVDDRIEAGRHHIFWKGFDDQGRRVPTGTYFSRLAMDGQLRVRKMTLIR